MAAHFLPRRRRWCQDGRTWSILRQGREVRSWTDYILGTDRRLFGNVAVRDPRHNSEHYMVLGCLHSASLSEQMWYLGGQKKLPLRPPTEPTREDEVFAALQGAVLKPLAREAKKNEWIIDGNVETRQRESLCAPGSDEGTEHQKEAGARHQGKSDGG